MASAELSPTPFGAQMRKHFLFSVEYKNLNHGSFGTYPVPVRNTLRELQDAAESAPDLFIRYKRPELFSESRSALAGLLNASPREIVFVKNATTGMGTVLHNLVFSPGDVLIYFDTVYGAVENAITYRTQTTPLRAFKVKYKFPISHAEIVRQFRGAVMAARGQGLNVKVAVFDTIVSQPGVRFPFESLIELCRAEEILSVVDGAHAVGQIPLDLGQLQPDFLVSNCHKWLYAPRGAAVLYVPLKNQHLLRTTLPTSWGFIDTPAAESVNQGKSAFEILFEWTATEDDAPYFCIPTALQFRQKVCGGEAAIFAYLETLARHGSDALADILGTEVMTDPQGDLRRCAMSTIRLPLSIAGGSNEFAKELYPVLAPADVSPALAWIQSKLIRDYKTMVPLFEYSGNLWVRVSAQIYLEKGDYIWLGGILKTLCERVGKEHVVQVEAKL